MRPRTRRRWISLRSNRLVATVQETILVLKEEAPHFVVVHPRLVIQMRNAGRHVDGHVGELIETLRELVHAPLETAEMSADECQLWMSRQHPVSRLDCSWYDG